jgi:hypothetical protein
MAWGKIFVPLEEYIPPQLAEEMAAQTRMVYDEESNTLDARGLQVNDYTHNSRVIFPGAQAGEKENNLVVMRTELLHQHREWVKENCNCRGEQTMNMSSKEQEGLKRIKKKVADGKIVILPTDKSGRFGVMSMATYIRAGMVHVGEDREIGIEERKANQKILNLLLLLLFEARTTYVQVKNLLLWNITVLMVTISLVLLVHTTKRPNTMLGSAHTPLSRKQTSPVQLDSHVS